MDRWQAYGGLFKLALGFTIVWGAVTLLSASRIILSRKSPFFRDARPLFISEAKKDGLALIALSLVTIFAWLYATGSIF